MRIGRTLPPAAAPIAWSDVCRGFLGMLHPGPALQALEAEIREDFHVPHVFLVSSGTAGLVMTLKALRALNERSASPSRPVRNEVVIPAYTCFSVPAAVVEAGLRPVLCDVDVTSFDFDHGRLADTLNERTLCVVAHHLFGSPAAIDRVRAVCRTAGAFLVEDAAQAMGAECGGRRLGTLGDVGIFSLGRGKTITGGSGGIVITSCPDIAGSLAEEYLTLAPSSIASQLVAFVQILAMATFVRPWLYWIPAGLPFLGLGRTTFPTRIRLRRLSGLAAGLLRCWRSRLAASNRGRAETAGYFARHLPVRFKAEGSHPWLRLPIVTASSGERARVYSASQKRGLGLSLAYPAPVNEIPEIRSAFVGQSFPSARALSERLLTLPTHCWVSDADRQAIAALCQELSSR